MKTDIRNEILDPDFLKKLENLSLLVRKMRRGERKRISRTYHRGSSLEFSDYRSYQQGDDTRSIDWQVYARLRKLFVKVFQAEENTSVHILLDTSNSMSFGNPSKLLYSKKIAAALGYIASKGMDRVGITGFSNTLGPSLRPSRHRNRFFQLVDFLAEIKGQGETDFRNSVHQYCKRYPQPGLAIILSDLLDPAGYNKALLHLLYYRYDVILIQILEENEIFPPSPGYYRFYDAENGQNQVFAFDEDLQAVYRIESRGFLTGIEDFCMQHGVEYIRATTIVPFEDLILRYLRRGRYLL